MHNYLLQAVEWSNQNFVGLGLQVYGLTTTLASSHYRIVFRAQKNLSGIVWTRLYTDALYIRYGFRFGAKVIWYSVNTT